MKKIIIEITNIIKVLFVSIFKLFLKLFKVENKNKIENNINNEQKKIEQKDNKKNNIKSDTSTTLPETNNTFKNPDIEINIKKELFAYEEIQNEIDKYLEDTYKIKIKKIEDKELLKDLEKFNKKIHEKINQDIETKWQIVNQEDLIKRTKYHIEDYFKEEKKLFEKPEEIEKKKELQLEKEKKESIKEDTQKKTTDYTIVKTTSKHLKTNNELQDIKQDKIATIDNEQKKTIKQNIKKQNELTTIVPKKEEVPSLSLKEEVINVVLSSSVILADIAKEIMTAPTIKEEDKKNIEVIETKKEEVQKEIEHIEQAIEKEIKNEQKEQLQETLKELKKQEKEIIKTKEVQEEAKQIELDIRPLEIDTLNVVKDTQEEQRKENIEDKNYDALEEEINNTIDKIENFIIKNEKYLTEDQKQRLRIEQNNLETIKNNIETQKDNEIRHEQVNLNEILAKEEINSVKAEISKLKLQDKLDLQETGLTKYEDLANKSKKESDKIEKYLLKKKIRRASRLSAIASLASIPFLHNPFFIGFAASIFVKSSLIGMHSTLTHKSIPNDPDLSEIKTGKDALERNINQIVDNINHLDYIKQSSFEKHPELKYDKEYITYVNNLEKRLNNNYERLQKKQYIINKYLNKTLKNVKVLKRERKKDPIY